MYIGPLPSQWSRVFKLESLSKAWGLTYTETCPMTRSTRLQNWHEQNPIFRIFVLNEITHNCVIWITVSIEMTTCVPQHYFIRFPFLVFPPLSRLLCLFFLCNVRFSFLLSFCSCSLVFFNFPLLGGFLQKTQNKNTSYTECNHLVVSTFKTQLLWCSP